MRTFTTTASRTAQRPFGHMASIGTPAIRTFDRQDEVVAMVRAERARRAAWAGCERRPLSIDKDLI